MKSKTFVTMIAFCTISSFALAESALKLHEATEQQHKAYDEYFIQNHDKHIQQVADLVAFPTLAMVPENAPGFKKSRGIPD